MDMLPDFDKNAAYIWTVYALATLTLGTTILITALRARSAQATEARLQAMREDDR
ncbi:MAG: heme exporter protein CcmD [Pseudomonadota bacterium]